YTPPIAGLDQVDRIQRSLLPLRSGERDRRRRLALDRDLADAEGGIADRTERDLHRLLTTHPSTREPLDQRRREHLVTDRPVFLVGGRLAELLHLGADLVGVA